jgi:hypothetical protein
MLSPKLRKEAKELSEMSKRDLTSPACACDGIPPYATDPDWRRLKARARPLSSVTLFYDRVGHF